MRYLVYGTQAEALADLALINARGRAFYSAAGYEIRADGAVIGEDADGDPDPRGLTVTWDVPRQRLDGKWVVLHPENQPMATRLLSEYVPGAAQIPILEIIMAGLASGDAALSGAAEDYAPSWWPEVAP